MNAVNVNLKLTEDPEILKVLRERGALAHPILQGFRGKHKPDMSQPEQYTVQVDGRPFAFTPGKVITVPLNIAEAIVNYRPLMGGEPAEGFWGGKKHEYLSALNADWTQVIEVVETWPVGEEAPSTSASRKTWCHACTPPRDLGTVAALRQHLAEHEEDEVAVQEVKGPGKPAVKIAAGAR